MWWKKDDEIKAEIGKTVVFVRQFRAVRQNAEGAVKEAVLMTKRSLKCEFGIKIDVTGQVVRSVVMSREEYKNFVKQK